MREAQRPKGPTGANALTTACDVRTAMVGIYKLARAEKMDSLVASRLVGILTSIQQMNMTGDVEARLAALEKQLGAGLNYLKRA